MSITRRQCMGFGLALPFAGSFLDLFAQDSKLETLINNGPNKKRFDLLMLPEGYTTANRKEFDEDVEEFVKRLENYAVLKEYKNLINVHKFWLPSEKDWNKDADGNGTAFGVTFDGSAKLPTFKLQNPNLKEFKLRDQTETDIPCIIVRDNGSINAGIGFRTRLAAPQKPKRIFFHELGHCFGLADEYESTAFGLGPNVSNDDKNLPWKDCIEKKVAGIGVYKVNGEKPFFRGEESPCLMQSPIKDTLDFGVLCTNNIILALRKYAKPIESAPDEKLASYGRNKALNIEIQVCPSRSYTPTVQAWYCSGKKKDLDTLSEDLRGKACTPDDFKDKKWKVATVKTDEKDSRKYIVTDGLSAGAYILAIVAKDPNPAIILDSESRSLDKRVYRIDVK